MNRGLRGRRTRERRERSRGSAARRRRSVVVGDRYLNKAPSWLPKLPYVLERSARDAFYVNARSKYCTDFPAYSDTG